MGFVFLVDGSLVIVDCSFWVGRGMLLGSQGAGAWFVCLVVWLLLLLVLGAWFGCLVLVVVGVLFENCTVDVSISILCAFLVF